MNPVSNILMNFMKQKLSIIPVKNDFKFYSKVLFSTYLFYFMFNSKYLLIKNKVLSVQNISIA